MSSFPGTDYVTDPRREGPPRSRAAAQQLAAALGDQTDMAVYAESLYASCQRLFFMGNRRGVRMAGALSAWDDGPRLEGETRPIEADGARFHLCLGAADGANARKIRYHLPFLRPVPCGLAKAAGTGDRLGLATPGHVDAFRAVGRAGPQPGGRVPIFPMLAQQSIRENERTGRSPAEVIDDAAWGAFQTGWTAGYGADADHLKTLADIDACQSVGFTFFTIDPGDRVDDDAIAAPMAQVEAKAAALDWPLLDSEPADLVSRLANRPIDLGSFAVTLSRGETLRAAAKYGPALQHTVRMARHLAMLHGRQPYDLEMSVDETATVTTLAEHIYLAHELQRLQIPVVSLAPRYTGTFEKGVDFIGNLDEFARSFGEHVAVAQAFGPYKLSLHSGSDKFSIYPIAAELAGDLIHLKTAGTSYLEALRAVGQVDPALFRALLDFAAARYPEERQAYHVSAQIEAMAPYAGAADADLPALLDDFHTRQILHVTFGSVLRDADWRARLMACLAQGEEVYRNMLATHFIRHLQPFA